MAGVKATFKDRHWDRLLREIEDGKIIPVVGPELLQVDIDGRKMPLSTHLAEQLIDRLDVDEDNLDDPLTLDAVACQYLRQGGDRQEIYYEVLSLIEAGNWPVPQPLAKLAAIKHFGLYLTTTFDPLLKKALDHDRYDDADRTPALAYTGKSDSDDLPADYNGKAPMVYHLFGKATAYPTYVVTEDDLLHFAARWQDRDGRPPNLVDKLRDGFLLTLGCNFSDWLTRFFIRGAKGDEILGETGARGVVADSQMLGDQRLMEFLLRRKTNIYPDGGAVEFVDELHKRWTERHGSSLPDTQAAPRQAEPGEADNLEPFERGSVFISYASEDRVAAQTLRDALEAQGIDVWFDQRRLEAGDDYHAKIFRNIEESSFFLPLISNNTTQPGRRFFRLEWHKAIEEQKFRPAEIPFIQPVVIDSTPPTAEFIPEEFKARHWQNFPGGTPGDEFLQLTRQRIRELRRRERATA
jgi:hypothetical protein